mgnify:CR=1 FL=1
MALQSHDTNTELVVEKYLKDHGLQVNIEEEDFGYGKLLIDYKVPKTTQLRIVSNRGILYNNYINSLYL